MNQTYRVGIIGCGGMGKSHASAYTQNPATKLVAAMDIRPESAKNWLQNFPSPQCTPTTRKC